MKQNSKRPRERANHRSQKKPPVEMAEDLELLDQQHHQLKISEKDQIIPDNHQEEPPATDLVGSPFVEECIKQEIATYKHEH